MAGPSHEYIPGVCNIGPAEIRQRQTAGWVGLIVTVGMAVGLIIAQVAPTWRLLLFVPAVLAAIGFLQSAWHFCAAFGLNGVFNFGPNVGKTDTVEQAEYRKQDRQTALQIIGLSVSIGLIVAVGAYYLPV